MQIIPGIEKTTSYIKKCKKSVDRIAVSVYNKIVAETKQQTRSDARVAQLVEHNLAKGRGFESRLALLLCLDLMRFLKVGKLYKVSCLEWGRATFGGSALIYIVQGFPNKTVSYIWSKNDS